MRREALLEAGYCDERFFLFGEDIDLSYRLLQTGFKNWYYPETTIIHFKGRSTRKAKLLSLFHFYLSMMIFVQKYYIKGDRLFILPLLHLAIILRAIAALMILGISSLIDVFKK
jgi:GT2 family glycosyltransferase